MKRSTVESIRAQSASVGALVIGNCGEGGKAISRGDTSTISMFDTHAGTFGAGDPTRGGKLQAKKVTDKTGRTETRYVAQEEQATPTPRVPVSAGDPNKTFRVSNAVASYFDGWREQHEDPDGHGLYDDERQTIGHLVQHYDHAGQRLRAPTDPDVADQMAEHLTDESNSADEQLTHKEGEGAHSEGRAHLRSVMPGLATLASSLRKHARSLRTVTPPASTPAPPAPKAAPLDARPESGGRLPPPPRTGGLVPTYDKPDPHQAASHAGEAKKHEAEANRRRLIGDENGAAWHDEAAGKHRTAQQAHLEGHPNAIDLSGSADDLSERAGSPPSSPPPKAPEPPAEAFDEKPTRRDGETWAQAKERYTKQGAWSHATDIGMAEAKVKGANHDVLHYLGDLRNSVAGMGEHSRRIAADLAKDEVVARGDAAEKLRQDALHHNARHHDKRLFHEERAMQTTGQVKEAHEKAARQHDKAQGKQGRLAAGYNLATDAFREEARQSSEHADHLSAEAEEAEKRAAAAPPEDMPTREQAKAKAQAHETKAESFPENHHYGVRGAHQRAAFAWQQVDDALRRAYPDSARQLAQVAARHSKDAEAEEAEVPHRARVAQAEKTHDALVAQHMKAAAEASTVDERRAHQDAADMHGFARKDAIKYSRGTVGETDASREEYEKTAKRAMERSERANQLTEAAGGVGPLKRSSPQPAHPLDAWEAEHGHLKGRIKDLRQDGGHLTGRFHIAAGDGGIEKHGEVHGQYGIHHEDYAGQAIHTVTHLPSGMAVGHATDGAEARKLAQHLAKVAPKAMAGSQLGKPKDDASEAATLQQEVANSGAKLMSDEDFDVHLDRKRREILRLGKADKHFQQAHEHSKRAAELDAQGLGGGDAHRQTAELHRQAERGLRKGNKTAWDHSSRADDATKRLAAAEKNKAESAARLGTSEDPAAIKKNAKSEAERHNQAAYKHSDQAKAARAAGNQAEAEAHVNAANAHRTANQSHLTVAAHSGYDNGEPTAPPKEHIDAARHASAEADGATRDAAQAAPPKVEPVQRAMDALRKILPHREADPEDRYRDRFHIPQKGHMHATSIENHPEMQKAKVTPRHIDEATRRLAMRGEVERMNTAAAGGGYSIRRTGEGGEDPNEARRRKDQAAWDALTR